MEHGTRSKYVNDKCDCLRCRAANAQAIYEARRRRGELIANDPSLRPHGQISTYKNWMCRCDECREANTAYGRAYQQRRKEQSQ